MDINSCLDRLRKCGYSEVQSDNFGYTVVTNGMGIGATVGYNAMNKQIDSMHSYELEKGKYTINDNSAYLATTSAFGAENVGCIYMCATEQLDILCGEPTEIVRKFREIALEQSLDVLEG